MEPTERKIDNQPKEDDVESRETDAQDAENFEVPGLETENSQNENPRASEAENQDEKAMDARMRRIGVVGLSDEEEYADDDEGMDIRWDGIPFRCIWKYQPEQMEDGSVRYQYINQATKTPYDPMGYDREGYDANGFDRKGFNREGIHERTGTQYSPTGYDAEGYDREGYNRQGRDREGYDREGYDEIGRDRRLYNREGWDWEGTNKYTLTEYDPEGYNMQGYDKDGYDRDGYNSRGFNRDGVDRGGFDEGGWKNGIHKKTGTRYNPRGFDQDGFDRYGLNRFGVDREGCDRFGHLDRDVQFAISFAESDVKSIREYAEDMDMTKKEAERTIRVGRAKCAKVDAQVREFLEDNQRVRMAVIRRDTAQYLNDELDFYQFWKKHPRLSVNELLRKFIPSDNNRLEYVDKMLSDFKPDDEHAFDNVRILIGAQRINVGGALENIQELKRICYRVIDRAAPTDMDEKRRKVGVLNELQRYLKPHQSQYLRDLPGRTIWLAENGDKIVIDEMDIEDAKRKIIARHGIISRPNVLSAIKQRYAKNEEQK